MNVEQGMSNIEEWKDRAFMERSKFFTSSFVSSLFDIRYSLFRFLPIITVLSLMAAHGNRQAGQGQQA
jgi:hypothetical protein